MHFSGLVFAEAVQRLSARKGLCYHWWRRRHWASHRGEVCCRRLHPHIDSTLKDQLEEVMSLLPTLFHQWYIKAAGNSCSYRTSLLLWSDHTIFNFCMSGSYKLLPNSSLFYSALYCYACAVKCLVFLQTAASRKAKGAPACDTHGVDLSQMSQVRTFAADVLEKYINVAVLVNNAGTGASSGSGPVEGEPSSFWAFQLRSSICCVCILILDFPAHDIIAGWCLCQ